MRNTHRLSLVLATALLSLGLWAADAATTATVSKPSVEVRRGPDFKTPAIATLAKDASGTLAETRWSDALGDIESFSTVEERHARLALDEHQRAARSGGAGARELIGEHPCQGCADAGAHRHQAARAEQVIPAVLRDGVVLVAVGPRGAVDHQHHADRARRAGRRRRLVGIARHRRHQLHRHDRDHPEPHAVER